MPGPWMIGEYEVALSATPAPEGWERVERPQTISAGLVAGWLRQGLVRRALVDICRALGASLEMLEAKAADARISETLERGFRDGRVRLYKRRSLGGGGGGGDSATGTGALGPAKAPARPLPPTPKKKTSIGFKVVDEDGNAVAAQVSVKLPDGSTRTLDLTAGHDFSMISNLEEGGECEVSLPGEYDPEWVLGRGDPLG
jgi:hypothetical protein